MKLLFTLLYIFLFSLTYSQTLTNRQVYDFEVGDVFQTKIYHSNNTFPSFFSDTIMSKSFSLNNDTVFYTINQLEYIPSQTSPTYNYSTIIKVYQNLDSIAEHNEPLHCSNIPITDTIYNLSNYCNQNTWQISSNIDTSCLEDTYYNSYLIDGCGGPYYDVISVSEYYEKVLLYFKKGSMSCGNTFSTEIEENQLENHIKIYPNPTNSTIHITFLQPISIKRYTINDIFGKKIGEYDYSKTIDVSNLKAGIYFITFLNSDFRMITKKIIKE